MLRFILQRKVFDRYSEADETVFETLDIDVPALQSALTRGGLGEMGHDITKLVGVEVLPAAEQKKEG